MYKQTNVWTEVGTACQGTAEREYVNKFKGNRKFFGGRDVWTDDQRTKRYEGGNKNCVRVFWQKQQLA